MTAATPGAGRAASIATDFTKLVGVEYPVVQTGMGWVSGPELTAAFLGRLGTAGEKAGLFQELDTDWLLLDAELLPWSVKAGDLIRSQYAAVGAAARTALPAAVAALEQAAARGLDVGDVLDRQRRRVLFPEG